MSRAKRGKRACWSLASSISSAVSPSPAFTCPKGTLLPTAVAACEQKLAFAGYYRLRVTDDAWQAHELLHLWKRPKVMQTVLAWRAGVKFP